MSFPCATFKMEIDKHFLRALVKQEMRENTDLMKELRAEIKFEMKQELKSELTKEICTELELEMRMENRFQQDTWQQQVALTSLRYTQYMQCQKRTKTRTAHEYMTQGQCT